MATATVVAGLAGCSRSSTPPPPASGPPTLRFEVLPAGSQSTTVLLDGPKVTSSFGATSLDNRRPGDHPTTLPYVSSPVQVSATARYEMHAVINASSPSVLGLPALIICKVVLRDRVIDERTGDRCDLTGRLAAPGR